MNDSTKTEVTSGMQAAGYRPKLCYYHANAKGTGSAVNLELHPAHWSAEGNIEGSIFMSIANQKTVGVRNGPETVFPSFDWKNRLTVRLTMSDISQMLMVFRGMAESVCDGKGLFHRSARYNTILKFEHRIEPCPGYTLEVYRRTHDGKDQQHAFIAFSPAEAIGLSLAIEQSIGVIAFGIPAVRERRAPATAAEAAPLKIAAGAESFSDAVEDVF